MYTWNLIFSKDTPYTFECPLKHWIISKDDWVININVSDFNFKKWVYQGVSEYPKLLKRVNIVSSLKRK